MAKSGINPKQAKSAYNKVKTKLAQLETDMNTLATDVEKMNKECWYGGKRANKWYQSMSAHYSTNKGSLVKFYNGVDDFQTELHKIFAKASAKGIDF